MMIRITAPVVEIGSVQLLRGRKINLPEPIALALVEREEAALVPFAEQAVKPRPETAVVPRPVSKPTAPVKPKGR